MMPWINSGNYEDSLGYLKSTKSEIVMGHFEIAGFEMDRGNVCHEGMDRKLFDKFDTVLSGHFHHKSSDGTITYLGNQYEITWADHGDTRGFHVFDTETRDLTFVPNPNKIFFKIQYDDSVQDFTFWKSYDFSQHTDCYVKVVVNNKQNAYQFDYVLDSLYKAGVADISIVEDFTDNTEIDDELVNEAEDTLTILSKYIDGLTMDVTPAKLKNLMRELYIESLNYDQISE